MSSALIIGGTGLVGRAVEGRLRRSGWDVVVTGRNPARMPAGLAADGVRFVVADRRDPAALVAAYGGGADLVVDCVCYTAADARLLLPLAGDAAGTVMISSRAVYVDADGNHSNADTPPRFAGLVTETQPTMAPSDDLDHNSREGYGPNKVAAELVLLDSGAPVTVLRPSKIHGIGAVKPNEWVFVKRVLDRRPVVFLAHRGTSVDQTSAAVNIAALIETVAAKPGTRILNSADPDAPDTRRIAATIAGHFGHRFEEILLDGAAEGPLGRLPWPAPYPFALDMSAAEALGYLPAGDYATTIAPTLDWLRAIAIDPDGGNARLPAGFDNEYFDAMCDYAAEDRRLRTAEAGPAGDPY
jgi:nucleoside-diphosphate-sugar epimerase